LPNAQRDTLGRIEVTEEALCGVQIVKEKPNNRVKEKTMSEGLKDSGTVTALAVIGLVFGLIGMLGSFIPCIGSLAFLIGIPAAILSGIAVGIAYSQGAKRTFAIVALTISLIGVVISGAQYFAIVGAGKKAADGLQQMQQQQQLQAPRPLSPPRSK